MESGPNDPDNLGHLGHFINGLSRSHVNGIFNRL